MSFVLNAAQTTPEAAGGLILGFGLAMMGIILVFGLLTLAFSVWALIDALRTPVGVWTAAHQSREVWIAVLAVGLFLGYGLIAALIYAFGVRPSLRRAMGQ